MYNLMTKEVEFQGSMLLAGQNKENDKIYVGVSWICNGLGLNKNQKDRQVKNVQEDIVLKQGCVKFDAGVFDKYNETIALDIEFLPLWLAKISITPTMQKENPEAVEKLVNYQLKAKDVLAEAFLGKKEIMSMEDLIIYNATMLKEQRLKQEEQDRKIKELEYKQTQQETKFTEVTDYISKVPDFKAVQDAVIKYSRLSNISHQDVRAEVYKRIGDIYGINFKKRIKNKHDELQKERTEKGKEPYKQSTLNSKYNAMSVIKDEKLEKQVIEVLMAMTKEL